MQVLRTGKGIAFGQMFAMTEYPQDVGPLYAQGYSLAEFLIYRGGRQKFVAFLADGMRDGQWSAAVERNYKIRDLPTLQNTWVAWVAQGFPAPPAESNVMTAAACRNSARAPCTLVGGDYAAPSVADARRARPEPNLIYHIPDKGAGRTAAGGTQILARPVGAAPPPAQRKTRPPTSPPQTLPAQGWRTVGGAPAENAAAQSSEATTSQVARPQTVEPSRQVILEWQQH